MCRKKGVHLSQHRIAVGILVEKGVSERRACLALEVSRDSVRYESRGPDPVNTWLREELRALSKKHRRWGSPRMTAVLQRGMEVNHKRIERIWHEEGFPVPRKRRKRRFVSHLCDSPAAAKAANETWSMDFVHNRTEYGQKLKMLTIVDDFTKECLEIRVEKRMRSREVMETLDEIMTERGAPKRVRTDNGPEFIAKELRIWLQNQGVEPVTIDPGCPWQNGYIESFNGKLRDECLNGELVYSRGEQQVMVDFYRDEYNHDRPHSSLGYRTPAEFSENSRGNSPEDLGDSDAGN